MPHCCFWRAMCVYDSDSQSGIEKQPRWIRIRTWLRQWNRSGRPECLQCRSCPPHWVRDACPGHWLYSDDQPDDSSLEYDYAEDFSIVRQRASTATPLQTESGADSSVREATPMGRCGTITKMPTSVSAFPSNGLEPSVLWLLRQQEEMIRANTEALEQRAALLADQKAICCDM